MDQSRVSIIILNWNGWKDTIECLESVFRLDYPDFQVVLVDNGSTDDSINKIKDWAAGKLLAETDSQDQRIRALVFPPVAKPAAMAEAEKAGANDRLLHLVAKDNRGFAAGNNIGLRFIQTRKDYTYVWLLNNDTVIDPASLKNLVKRMKETPQAGIGGSAILHYHDPSRIWAMGGGYDRWFAQGSHLEANKLFDYQHTEKYFNIGRKLGYVVGASMLISRPFLEQVGLLCEDYFIFFEELDWAVRGRRRNFGMTIAPASLVYHKGGASIKRKEGEASARTARFSLMFDHYLTKNRLLFTLKFYPYALPMVYLSVLGYMLDRVRLNEWDNVKTIFQTTINHFRFDLLRPLNQWINKLFAPRTK
jgi:GT2 family glycosyltransferase